MSFDIIDSEEKYQFPILRVDHNRRIDSYKIKIKNVGTGPALLEELLVKNYYLNRKEKVNVNDDNNATEVKSYKYMKEIFKDVFEKGKAAKYYGAGYKNIIKEEGTWLAVNEEYTFFKIKYTPNTFEDILEWAQLFSLLMNLAIKPKYRSEYGDSSHWDDYIKINPRYFHLPHEICSCFPIIPSKIKQGLKYNGEIHGDVYIDNGEVSNRMEHSLEEYRKFLRMPFSTYMSNLSISYNCYDYPKTFLKTVRDLWDYSMEDLISLGFSSFYAKVMIYR